MAASQYAVPDTPRVISPSPTPSELSGKDGYFPPTTRSKATKTANGRISASAPISENGEDSSSDPELSRARPRSRSPQLEKKPSRRMSGIGAVSAKSGMPSAAASKPTRRKPEKVGEKDDGHLSPTSAVKGYGSAYWRQLSRSPSPLGLIPIHREWRSFIHRHEIPRKFLHVSIGFVTLHLYRKGVQPSSIHPILLTLLIPIFAVDVVRLHYEPLNRIYIRLLGAMMRESEAHDKYNGVISYLGGAWFVMRFCQKDVAVMSVLLLSWCDTAASTFGRLWGRYTPRIRRGKSLAGTLAAFTTGVVTALLFWGVVAPMAPESWNSGENSFAYAGGIGLPKQLREQLGWTQAQSRITGPLALAGVSVWAGLVASASEAVDLWGLDDNLTIPVLCGIGLGGFLGLFGTSG